MSCQGVQLRDHLCKFLFIMSHDKLMSEYRHCIKIGWVKACCIQFSDAYCSARRSVLPTGTCVSGKNIWNRAVEIPVWCCLLSRKTDFGLVAARKDKLTYKMDWASRVAEWKIIHEWIIKWVLMSGVKKQVGCLKFSTFYFAHLTGWLDSDMLDQCDD